MEAGGPTVSEPIRLFIVDDHDIFRSGLKAELPGRFEVVGEASDTEGAIELITERRPDVVLLDVHLPGGGGQVVVEKVKEAGVETAFLALSASDAAGDVVSVVRAGARGYVTKTIATPELIQAIEKVAGGDAVFSPRLAGFVLDAFSSIPVDAVDAQLGSLTEREREVLQLIARGYTYRETGEELYISVKTVESHVSSVLRKLQLSNRNELTRWAAERRLI
jgi:DNA-binding NarL/FixJ family response regulator